MAISKLSFYAIYYLLVVSGLIIQTGCSTSSYNETPAQMARRAFFIIEEHPFHRKEVRQAQHLIEDASETAPMDPWVLIALSRIELEKGYIKGDRSDLWTYRASSVEKAGVYAKKAVEFGATESMAYVQFAQMQIITQDYKGAWETLNKAHELEPQGFYPWYYRSVISFKMRDPDRALEALKEAEQLAVPLFQKAWVVGRQINLARFNNDETKQEELYKKAIALEPSEPHPYGNYASFLKNRKRYEEAITYYNKAIAISPYPLATEELKQTLLLKNTTH